MIRRGAVARARFNYSEGAYAHLPMPPDLRAQMTEWIGKKAVRGRPERQPLPIGIYRAKGVY